MLEVADQSLLPPTRGRWGARSSSAKSVNGPTFQNHGSVGKLRTPRSGERSHDEPERCQIIRDPGSDSSHRADNPRFELADR